MEARVYLNAQPIALRLMEGSPTEKWKESNTPLPAAKNQTVQVGSISPNVTVAGTAPVAPNLIKPAEPMRILTSFALAKLQRQNDDTISRMTKDLDKEAHFPALRGASVHRIPSGRLSAAVHDNPAQCGGGQLNATNWRRSPLTSTWPDWCGRC